VSLARSRRVLLAALLAGAVVAVYAQVRTHGFVEYDDPAYVRNNPIVRQGLTWEGLRWAFTTGRMGNWNPLTWLSHMLDVQLFGLQPGAHHLVSVALHVANTLLLFGVWQRMTAAPWPSLVVAALFGLHPLHVESVAWISERKDVLSTLGWFLTLWAYARYVETRARRWYAATAAAFALGLMAKPMLVTLPFVLLLLDFWPLGRLVGPHKSNGPAASATRRRRSAPATPDAAPASPAALVWEKVPLLILTAAFSAAAYVTQLREGAVAEIGALPLGIRIANALVAYVRYLMMAVWPADLAVLYPFDVHIPLWQPVLAALCLGAASLWVLRSARQHPYAVVGWLWYLGTLVPVIGIVQIGSQALADRYTYVPLVGIFVMLAWGGQHLARRWAVPPLALGALVSGAIAAYAVVAWAQVGLWRTSETLLAHTLRVTRANCIAHNNLGVALADENRADAALAHFQEALRIKPDYADAYNNVGLALWREGRREEAALQYRNALRYQPNLAEPHNNLGLVLTELGRIDEALPHFSAALRLDPQFASAHLNLGNALRDSGRTEEAVEHYEEALRIRPDFAEPHNNLGSMLAEKGQRDAAEARFRAALERDPTLADALVNLALLLHQLARRDESIEYFQRALEVEPDEAQTHNDLGVVLVETGQLDQAIGHFEQALRLDPDLPDARVNLEIAREMAKSSRAPE